MKTLKIKKLTQLVKTPFLNFYDCEYENKVGDKKHWMIASRKDDDTLRAQYFNQKEEQIDAVIVVAHHETTKELVLIRQFRVPLNDYIYELPAGLIDSDEEPMEAAIREMKEETGLTLTQIDEGKSRLCTYLSAGMTEESAALIYGACIGEVSKDYLEADEDIMPILVSKEKAREILKSTEKIDIKAYMVLQEWANS